MKITLLKSLMLTTLLFTTLADVCSASALYDSPKRRKFTSEQTAEDDDSTKQVKRDQRGVHMVTSPKTSVTRPGAEEYTETEATNSAPIRHVRPNTPQQIDSVLAMWRTSSTQEAWG